jgi:hypothetical protein
MAQVYGQAVTSEDVERLTGRDFGPAGTASKIVASYLDLRLTAFCSAVDP